MGHDYSLYHSQAGGCCDCGDLTSWTAAGCCPRHRPGEAGAATAAAAAELLPAEAAVARVVAGAALARLQLAVEAVLALHLPAPDPDRNSAALSSAPALGDATALLDWLTRLAAVPALRGLLGEEALRPLGEDGPPDEPAPAPEEVAGVVALLEGQRRALLARLAAALPSPEVGTPGAGPRSRRPLPPPAAGAPSLLYWLITALVPGPPALVVVRARGWAIRECR